MQPGVIPYRGSWLDFEFDAKDILNVRIDRKRKLPATTLMMALPDSESLDYLEKCAESGEAPDVERISGMSQEILGNFYRSIIFRKHGEVWEHDLNIESLKGMKLNRDLVDAKTKKVIAKAGSKMTPRSVKKLAEEGLKAVIAEDIDLIGRFAAERCSKHDHR